jgi:hypothetical protein
MTDPAWGDADSIPTIRIYDEDGVQHNSWREDEGDCQREEAYMGDWLGRDEETPLLNLYIYNLFK